MLFSGSTGPSLVPPACSSDQDFYIQSAPVDVYGDLYTLDHAGQQHMESYSRNRDPLLATTKGHLSFQRSPPGCSFPEVCGGSEALLRNMVSPSPPSSAQSAMGLYTTSSEDDLKGQDILVSSVNDRDDSEDANLVDPTTPFQSTFYAV